MKLSDSVKANVAAATAYTLLGIGLVATRLALREADATAVPFIRSVIGTVLLIPLTIRVGRVPTRGLMEIFLVGGIAFGLLPLISNAGMARTPAWHGALIVTTAPIWTLTTAVLLRIEKMRIQKFLGVMAALVGVGATLLPSFATGSNAASTLSGDGLMLGYAAGASLASLGGAYLVRTHPPLAVVGYGRIIGTLVLWPMAVLGGPLSRVFHYSAITWASIIFLSISAPLADGLTLYALKRSTPTRVGVFINLIPITTGSLAKLLLKEPLSLSFMIGTLFVMVGVLVVNAPRFFARRRQRLIPWDSWDDAEDGAQASEGGLPFL